MYELLVSIGGRKQRIPVPPSPAYLVVGKASDCDVVVQDLEVDDHHLEVGLTDRGVAIRDQKTKWGTRVNGSLVREAVVTPGDEISIGAIRIFLSAVAESAPPKRPSRAPAAPRKRPESRPKASVPTSPPKAPGERRRQRRGNGVLLIVGAVVVLAIGAVAFLTLSESGRVREANEAYDRAYALWEKKELDEAESGFTEIVTRWPDTNAAPRAKKAIEEISAYRGRIEKAIGERVELLARWNRIPFTKMTVAWDRLAKEYEDTSVFTDRSLLDSVKPKYAEEAARRRDAVAGQAMDLLRAGRYWDAVLAWHEYVSIETNTEPDRDAADREIQRILDRARSAFDVVARDAERLIAEERFVEAKALIRGKLGDFRGTRYAFDLRQKLDRAEVLSRVETAEPAKTAEVVVRRDEYLREAQKAESLVERRRYGEAVALYEKVAAKTPFDDLKAEFTGRATDLADYAFLIDELLRQINESPEKFTKIALGGGLTANAISADANHILVALRGAKSKLTFARMGAGRILDLLLRLSLDAAGRLKLARFALEAGNEEAGHEAVTKALRADESLADKAFVMLARARGIPVPAGGFVAHRGRWMTPTEKKAAELLDAIRAAERLAVSTDDRRRDEGLAKLRELGEPALEALVRALTRQREALVGRLLDLPLVRDPATKAMLFQAITERRQAALKLIFDAVRYPYPYGPDQAKVQAEVDGLVDQVRIVWERPVSLLLEKHPELKALFLEVEEYSKELVALRRPPAVSFDDLAKRVNAAVGIRRYAPGSKEKSALEWNDKVLVYNEKLDIGADGPEKACVLATNEYRIMMGRRAVMMNAELLKCARGHSTDMKTNGFFAHDCTIPGHEAHKTPGQRARIAGYGGGVSENIARGSEDGRATFKQWYGSSGHHRNLLVAGHTEVGVGRDGDFWTQNFGRAKAKVDLPGERPGRR